MLKRFAIWYKLPQNVYKFGEHSDESMATLSLFLGDGLPPEDYIDFLQDVHQKKFSGNISILRKTDDMVTVILFDDFFADMEPFSTTQNNLIKIVREWNRLEDLLVDKIEVILDDDELTIFGH